uniref:nucleotide sugar transporter SLC35D2 isoform X2 n=1 Tax=Centroberyx gerrardi TaxID=166262 RepID=UPI003AB10341
MSAKTSQEAEHPGLLKLSSAVFYAGSSFLITVVNKTVLTSFRFPSYMCLGIGQMITTIVVLYAAKMNKTVQFQDFDRSILLKIFPLPLLYVGNHITGLASTKKLSLPMFTVLRKFTILMTMILEAYVLRKTFPKRLVYSVVAIVLGAMFAARFVLMYSIILCSHYNSALTTTVVGAIKNVAVAYVGIFVGGDYLFSWTNFLGLTICMSGGLVYSYLTFNNKTSSESEEGTPEQLKIHITEDSTGKCSAN